MTRIIIDLTPEVNRAFSAGAFGSLNPGALPQAGDECCAFGAEQILQWSSVRYSQYSPRTPFSLPPASGADEELLNPRAVMWLSTELFVAVPRSVCSWAMTAMLKTAKATATAPATVASIDNFIWENAR